MTPLLVTRQSAANSLAISLRTFEEKVQKHVRTVRIGRCVLVEAASLAEFVEARAR